MPKRSDGLCEEPAPSCSCALVLIDVVNDLEFEGAERLLARAKRVAVTLRSLVARARKAGVPVIYANDNFGHWRSNFEANVRHCLEDGVRGRSIVENLVPLPSDYFVLKPKQSAFFETPLDTLLRRLGTRTLILTGLAGDNCVLFTAHDAYMRDYRIVVPNDCIASERPSANRWTLEHMRHHLHAATPAARRIRFATLCRSGT